MQTAVLDAIVNRRWGFDTVQLRTNKNSRPGREGPNRLITFGFIWLSP
jgi:hypothetical protein